MPFIILDGIQFSRENYLFLKMLKIQMNDFFSKIFQEVTDDKESKEIAEVHQKLFEVNSFVDSCSLNQAGG